MSSLPFSVLDVGKKREREREDKRETQPRSRARTFQAPATDVDLVKIARTMEGMRQLGNADEDDDENDGRNYGDTEVTSSSASSSASSSSSSASAMQRKELDARTHDSMLRGTDADPSAPKPVSTRRDWTLQSFDAAASAPSIPAPPVVSESFAQQQRQQQLPAPFSSPIESKLDLIIHLLEDQQDMRTDRVVEDMLLYACLGIFIIFAIDTFSTTRRYTR